MKQDNEKQEHKALATGTCTCGGPDYWGGLMDIYHHPDCPGAQVRDNQPIQGKDPRTPTTPGSPVSKRCLQPNIHGTLSQVPAKSGYWIDLGRCYDPYDHKVKEFRCHIFTDEEREKARIRD